jgi:hypothetical protein
MIKHKLFTILFIATISMTLINCKENNNEILQQITSTLEGTWGVDNSSLTEHWYRKNNDTLAAISYYFEDNGDSAYLSNTYIYKKDDKLFLDVINKNNKLKLYYFKEKKDQFYIFNAISKDFYPYTIKYKEREPNNKTLESNVSGKIDTTYKEFNFSMYKIK